MERLFGLDIQLLFDAVVNFIFIMVLFIVLSKLFFKPVRAFLEKRDELVNKDIETGQISNDDSQRLKTEYEAMLKEVNKEAESILSASRKQAIKRQEEILARAKQEASTIVEQANIEAALEKAKVKDEVKLEMASIASMMANQFAVSKDPFREALLLEETLKEMGDEAWQN